MGEEMENMETAADRVLDRIILVIALVTIVAMIMGKI